MSHNLNAITLEVNAATDLVDRDTFATVFAIHHRYAGQDRGQPREKSLPISVLFGANTISLARKAVRKGCHFAVTGSLDYERRENARDGAKEFFTIRADRLSIYPATAAAAPAAEPPSPASPRTARPTASRS
jgi:hypothetical protein